MINPLRQQDFLTAAEQPQCGTWHEFWRVTRVAMDARCAGSDTNQGDGARKKEGPSNPVVLGPLDHAGELNQGGG